MIRDDRGLTLVEALMAMIILVVASICALRFFSFGLGNINIEGDRRAALEVARSRMDQLMLAKFDRIKPSTNATLWLSCPGCSGDSYNWTWTNSTAVIAENATINGHANRRRETSVQWKGENGTTHHDILLLSAKAWYRPGNTDNDYNRVELRSLRAE